MIDMRLASLFLLLIIQTVVYGQEAAPPSGTEPEALVRQLESNDFDVRQNATQQIEALGLDALPALEKVKAQGCSANLETIIDGLMTPFTDGSLVVEVFDRSGRPLKDLKLRLNLSQWSLNNEFPRPGYSWNDLEGATDAQGRAIFKNLKPGYFHCSITISGVTLLRNGNGVNDNDQLGRTNTFVELQRLVNRLQIVVTPHGRIKGMVVDENGKPVAGASVASTPDNGIHPRLYAPDAILPKLGGGVFMFNEQTTDENGAFDIEVPAGNVVVAAVASETIVGCVGLVSVTPGQTTKLDRPVQLKRAEKFYGAVRLQFLNADAAPVANTRLNVRFTSLDVLDEVAQSAMTSFGWGPTPYDPDATTDEKGYLLIKNGFPGQYAIDAQIGDAPELHSRVSIAIGQTSGVVLRPEPAGIVSGRVLRGKDEPLRGAVVRCFRESAALSDELQQWFQFRMTFRPDFPRAVPNGAVTDDHGVFTIEHVAPETYTLLIQPDYGSAPKSGSSFVFGVKVEKGNVKLEDIVLESQAPNESAAAVLEISGTTVDTLSNPLECRLTLKCRKYGQRVSHGTGTDKTGHFRMLFDAREQMEPQFLIAKCEGYQPVRVDLNGTLERIQNLKLTLQKLRHGSLRVLVSDEAGKPLSNAVCRVRATDRTIDGKTDTTGEAAITGLASGQRTVWISADGYRSVRREFEIKADDAVELKVALAKLPSLRGRVALPAGVNFKTVLVCLRQLDGEREVFTRTVSISLDGVFTADSLPGLKYEVYALAPGFISSKRQVISPDRTPEVNVDLQRWAAIRLDLGPGARGKRVSLRPTQDGNFVEWLANFYNFSTYADGTGKVEFFGLPSGAYDVFVAADAREGPLRWWRIQNIVAAQIGAEDELKRAPVKCELLDGKCSITGILKVEPGIESGAGTLLFIGERSTAALRLEDFFAFLKWRPALKGTVPLGVSLHRGDTLQISDLLPGRYDIVLATRAKNGEPPPKLIKSIDITQDTDIGTLSLPFAKWDGVDRSASEPEEYPLGLDKPGVFQP